MTCVLRILAIFIASIAIAGCGARSPLDAASSHEDVTGTIVDVTNTPWPGRQVLVGDTLATTDEAGHFKVRDVAFPYDLAINATHDADVYVGMSDPAPTVFSQGLAPGSPARSGSMTLTVVLPAADTNTVHGCVEFEKSDNLTSITVSTVKTAPEPLRTFNVSWVGQPSTVVRIHAFETQVDPTTSAPVHYLGYDTTDLVLADQGKVTWTASYKPPPFSESPLAVTVSLPEGYGISRTFLVMNSTDVLGNAGLIQSEAAGPEISLVVPDLAAAPFGIAISTRASDGSAESTSYALLPAGTQKLAVQVEPAPTLIAPPEGGTIGVGSTITWTGGGPGAPFTTLEVLDGKGAIGPFIVLWGGADGSVTVPNLSALGLPLPHGATCNVGLFHDSRETTVEDFASMRHILPAQNPRPSSLTSTGTGVTTD
jgi:hypothetical protein